MEINGGPWSGGFNREEKRASRVLELALRRGMLLQVALDKILRVRGIEPEKASAVESLDAILEGGLLHPSTVAKLEREIEELENATPVVLDEFDEPPVREWDRYELIEFVGRGGMGDVYKARDPRLGRLVAIKFLRRDDPQVLARFVREARIQARVDHEGVCPVYEVGEVGGHPYIVMQFVSGGALPEIRSRLRPREMVQIIADVAEALHAAHRLDLVHRDVKPANIMVEFTEGGLWRPFVVDFGIARELDSGGLTVSGAVLGTPAFAAPEQIRGETQKIDARSDVYSLGATLYWLITGRAPFEGGFAEILREHTTADGPEPPSSIEPEVSRDLDTIILKCLEIDRNRRYDSAFDVAEDLRRYLAGEPILARRANPVYRMLRRLRRRPVFAGALAALVVTAVLVVGYTVFDRWRTARQAAVVQTLLDRVSGIEELMRISVMMPLHDSSREREIVHQRIEEIRSEISGLGSSARGPGRFALGRAHLLLGETESALEDLRAAWESGFRSPATAAAYGRALGLAYEKELRASRHVESPELRKRIEKRLSETLRKPALELLHRGSGSDLESPAAVMARIAFYEGRMSQARKEALRAVDAAPWDYASFRLLGDMHAEQAGNLAFSGNKDAALELLRTAREDYGKSLEVARSDPETLTALCHCRLQEMEILERNGRSGKDAFEAAKDACMKARRIAPREHGPWEITALLLWKRAEQLWSRGENPAMEISEAISAAEKAISLDDSSSMAHHVLGGCLGLSVQVSPGREEDAFEKLQNALDALKGAADFAPWDPVIADDLGFAYDRKARYLMRRGLDPREDLTKALEAYQRAISLSPDYPNAYNNSGIAWWRRAVWEERKGLPFESSLVHAEEFFTRALKINPRYTFALVNLGMVHRLRGTRALRESRDPGENISRSLQLIGKAIEINPRLAYAFREKARSGIVLVRWKIFRSLDADDVFIETRNAAEKALELDPESSDAHVLSAEIHLLHAALLMRSGRSAERELSRTLAGARKALEIDPHSAEAFLVQAEALGLMARRGADPERSGSLMRQIDDALNRARNIRPGIKLLPLFP